jgi:peptidyl-prolyl cis-trans isomerase SurA
MVPLLCMSDLNPPFICRRTFVQARATAVALSACLALAYSTAALSQGSRPAAVRAGDYIVAVVGSELVTAGEVQRRIEVIKQDATQQRQAVPPDAELRRQVLDSLIDERAILVHARDSGVKVDDVELDRAVQSVAAQNKLTLPQMREQLAKEGLEYSRFRAQLRDQMMVERVREREVGGRIKVSDDDIDAQLATRRGAAGQPQYNVAQILVALPERADEATVARLKAKADQALSRVRSGESFGAVAKELSDDPNKDNGGEFGMRAASRIPEVFVGAVKSLKPGEVSPSVLRTAAGFHVLRLVESVEPSDITVVQTRVRHILLRPSAQLTQDAIVRQLNDMKRQVESGARKFEDLAKQHSIDGSAEQGGDLGFAPVGAYVAEFEAAMNSVRSGGLSTPVVTRFGVHLIQVLERKDVKVDNRQLREQARASLREQRFELAYTEWVRELRGRAYVEMRDAP